MSYEINIPNIYWWSASRNQNQIIIMVYEHNQWWSINHLVKLTEQIVKLSIQGNPKTPHTIEKYGTSSVPKKYTWPMSYRYLESSINNIVNIFTP